ncbi:response regulator [Chitinophagaceae bacterium LB-8]|uniref:histidine kinase n=1 Tax=Paraflavisolibacter caeni TaxID=2982496 RepID=A0A9X2XVZ8_9BACT|nr:hybrid sensor histidine kinase/response regulator [Paraflavisolibacter caeni]MCU7549642.1 response regulator [Paraflavisolibacter caeni]
MNLIHFLYSLAIYESKYTKLNKSKIDIICYKGIKNKLGRLAKYALALLLITLFSFCTEAQLYKPKFIRITTNEGLSQNHVSAILKDRYGFMWFATENGLDKYDGYQFISFKHDKNKPETISSNYVFDIIEDENSILWIGTARGLNKFNRTKETFTRYLNGQTNTFVIDIFIDSKKRMWLGTAEGLCLFNAQTGKGKWFQHNDEISNSLSNNFIFKIAEDNYGELWIATDSGFSRFNPETQNFINYRHDPANKKSIAGNRIKAVFKDSRGNIWAGTQGYGISMYNRNDNSFISFSHDPGNPNSIGYNDILSFVEGNDGKLWIGTENGGISVMDGKTNQFTTYKNEVSDHYSLSNNSVYSLYRDNTGNIWAGTWSGGVNFLPRFGDKFNLYRQIPNVTNSLSNNSILTVTGDKKGNLWIGTDGGGLNYFDRKTKQFTHYRNDPKNENSIKSDYVLSVVEIGNNMLALGYHRGGFDLFNLKTGSFSHHMPNEKDSNSIAASSVNVVYQDREGNFWLATWSGGLNLYNSKTKKITRYQHNPNDPKSICSNFVTAVYEDHDRNIWVGTVNGFDLFDSKNNRFIHHKNDPKNKRSISNNYVDAIYEDEKGNLWLGTQDGLNYFDKKTGIFTAYTEKDGLGSNIIKSILPDHKGNLWVGTYKGLSKFNIKAKSFRNYTISDGLQGNEFKAKSCYQAPDGEMFFGGAEGLNSFYPDSVKDNHIIPPVYITNLQIFNKPVHIDSHNSPLHSSINAIKEIVLSYKQSVFTIEFAALNYIIPSKNQYAYKLEGFDEDWNYVGNKRSATYTNLDAGTYFFRVKASNNDGIWNEKGATLKIIITPPIWGTWWFKVVVFVFVAGSALLIYYYRMRSINAQRHELERLVVERTEKLARKTEEAEQANRAKSMFLATMSHEIRTPMNGVIGMASLLSQTTLNSEQKMYADVIRSSGENLLGIINDILDFSKIESGKMELESEPFNLRCCIEEVLETFSVRAAEHNLDLVYIIQHDVPPYIVGDSLRLRQILFNLVGNAIKFTKQGEIFIDVSVPDRLENDHLRLNFNVKDTGIGIKDDKLEKLFKSFSQVDSSTTRKHGGTGLGLAICEKLVALMGGSIHVVSEYGKGSTFSFNILTMPVQEMSRDEDHPDLQVLAGKNILIIDDNNTVLASLQYELEPLNIKSTLSNSPKKALELFSRSSSSIDTVLIDLHIPEMNGIQLAQELQKINSSIPLLLLRTIKDKVSDQDVALFKCVLHKPIKLHLLQKCLIEALLNTRPAAIEKRTSDLLQGNFSKEFPLNILVAEDNPVNQMLIVTILKKLGYLPKVANSGSQALEMAVENPFDVILMDVQMPEMDGCEATRFIRKTASVQPKIIAMTANVAKEEKEECINAGMDDFISKPINLEELINKLQKWASKTENPLAN